MESGNDNWLRHLSQWLAGGSEDTSAESVMQTLTALSAIDLENVLQVVVGNFEEFARNPLRLRVLMQAASVRLRALCHDECLEWQEASPPIDPDLLAGLYERLCDVDALAACHALQTLAVQGDGESIHVLASIMRETPPTDWKTAAVALNPLWNAEDLALELFFDGLGDGFVHPASMSVILDLANHAFRLGKLSKHPYANRHAELSELLQQVNQRLVQLERDPAKFGSQVAEVQQILSDAVALTVSLCDALGQIGKRSAVDGLSNALELSHRRIQAEAAGALARLGDQKGVERLIALASDRVARLRAVHYAEELGIAEQIDEQLRLPYALAESELAIWLASPEQFGLPPTAMELVDSRTLYWPSYDEPQSCYLFRFSYRLPAQVSIAGGDQHGQLDSAVENVLEFSNIGIAGPVTHAFQADLANLPADDIYAAFAGWQAEHEDIFEVPMAVLNPEQRREADRLLESLEHLGLRIVEPIALTFFLGEIAILAKVEKEGKQLCCVSDGAELLCLPATPAPNSLTPEVALAIYRGRKLLRTFNT